MDAVGGDEDIAAHGFRAETVRGVDELHRHASFGLREPCQPTPGFHCLGAQPLHHRVIEHFLEPSAVDGKLWHWRARPHAAPFAPDLLPEAVQVNQLFRPDAGGVQHIQQVQLSQFLDGMGERVDADADLSNRRGLLIDRRLDPAFMQHQGKRQPSDPAACN